METSKFNPDVARIVAEKYSKTGKSLFMFEIYFKPNQHSFSISDYQKEFNKVIDFSSTYGGALITVEGHSDPMGYLRKKKENANPLMLKRISATAGQTPHVSQLLNMPRAEGSRLTQTR